MTKVLCHEYPRNSGLFKTFNFDDYIKYTNDNKDGWFFSTTNRIIKILHFKNSNPISILGVEVMGKYENIYNRPLESMKLGMFMVGSLQLHQIQLSESNIKHKLFYFTKVNETLGTSEHYFMTL